MIKEKRLQLIREYVLERQSVSLDELVEAFNVSKNTIRRDAQELVESEEFEKVYGGIKAKESRALEPFQMRKVRNHAEKTAIGMRAADFVEDGDVIFIDSGTTTIEMADALKHKSVTVLTNNIEFVMRVLPYDSVTVMVIGGILDRKINSLGRPQNIDLLKMYNVTKAFMASTGLSLSNGVTNASPLETELKQLIVSRSRSVFLLADHDKIGKYGLTTYCDLTDIDCLITDKPLPQEYEEYAQMHAIDVVYTH